MNYGFIGRHGTTKLNAAGMPRALSDVPLDKQGIAQSYAMGKLLLNKKVTSIRASRIERTKHTAKIVGKVLGIKPEFTKRLDTLNIGPVFSKMKEKEADKKILPYIIEYPNKILPLGQSYNAWLEQIWPELYYFFTQIASGQHPLIVSHGRLSQAVDALIVGGGKEFARKVFEQEQYTQKPGEVFSVLYDRAKFYFQKV